MNERKIILNLTTSLDWYIEWPNWEFDWCFTDQDYWMKEFLSWVDIMFLWKKSYELFKNDIKEWFPDIKQIVFSRTMKDESLEIISNNISEEIGKIKSTLWKDIWLFGWAKLIKSLLDLKLIDEIIVSIHPLILGSWTPLFLESYHRTKLKLINSKCYSSWLVQNRYNVEY